MKSGLFRSSLLAVVSSTAFLSPAPLQGGAVIEGITATATSWWDDQLGAGSIQWVGNLTNNSGLSAPYDLAATHAPHNDAVGMWHAKQWSVDPNPTITFNLGGSFDLEGMHVWNGNQALNTDHIQRGVKDFELSVSTNGGTSFTVLGNRTLVVSPLPAQPVAAQVFDLSGRNGVTHVKIRVLSNHHPGNNDYSSLSEVMFTAAEAPFQLTRFELGQGTVTLAFPSEPGQVFDIYRSADLAAGFGTPRVEGLLGAIGNTVVDSVIDGFGGGLTLGDSRVNFGTVLTSGVTYFLIPGNGQNAGREIAVQSWSGNTVTVTSNIGSDLTWTGAYKIRTATPVETEWVDTNPLAGRAFYRVRRR
jgi:hypothetical protein